MKRWLVLTAAALVVTASGGLTPSVADDGTDLARLQEALKQQGHDPGPIDGVDGPRTQAALKAYQHAQGLEATGRLDDATRAKLGGPAKSTSQTQTGGDTRPAPADPAQSNKTGANVGEGASYSRSTQK